MDFRFTLSHTPKQSVTSVIDLPDNSLGENVGAGDQSWSIGSVPSVTLPGDFLINPNKTSKIYALDYTFGTGLTYNIEYSITYSIDTNSVGAFVDFLVLDGADNIQFTDQKFFVGSSGTMNESSSFIASSGAVKYGFRVQVTNTPTTVGTSDFDIENNATGTASTQAESGMPTSLQITEPDGWKGCKLKLERHEDFHSLIEHYEGGAGGAFIFYGNNGQENGGIEFLKGIEQIYGFDAQINILTEFSFDSINYEEIFTGQVDVSAKDEMVDNLMQAPIIRDDFWTKFISRRDTPIDLSSNVDLDGNAVDPAVTITINLTDQKINQYFFGYLPVSTYNFNSGIAGNGYIQIDFDDRNEFLSTTQKENTIDEIDEHIGGYPIIDNPSQPSPSFDFEFPGDVTVDNLTIIARHATDDTTTHLDPDIKGYLFDGTTEHLLTRTDYLGSNGTTRRSRFIYSGTISNVKSLAIYLKNDSGTTSSAVGLVFDDQVEIGVPGTFTTQFDFFIKTEYADTTAQGFLVHDLFYSVLQRMGLGRSPFYSEFLGSQFTNQRQYSEDGCGWMYAVVKGLQVRGYSLSEKPFFISFNQIWNGIHPILCLGLSYEEMDDSPASRVIRCEQMEHFFSDDVSINFSNVRNIHSYYDTKRIFKTIKVGYKKWQSEDISGIDDPNTKRAYDTGRIRIGQELHLESDFIAAGLALEKTRRTKREKSEDYKYDNDNFIIALNQNDISPDRYAPELDENFDQVTSLLNSDTRYNLILTPMRNLLRWAKFIGGCMQSYSTSAYRFVSGEGNYNMLTDYSCGSGNQCQAIVCDPLSERQDISLSDYNSLFGYLHLAQECEMVIPMTKDQYDVIKNNRKKSIGISQTDSNFTKFKIKLLEYDLIQGQATIKAWPKTFFNIQVIDDPIEMPNCEPETPECLGDDLRLTEESEFRMTEDDECRELELIN